MFPLVLESYQPVSFLLVRSFGFLFVFLPLHLVLEYGGIFAAGTYVLRGRRSMEWSMVRENAVGKILGEFSSVLEIWAVSSSSLV